MTPEQIKRALGADWEPVRILLGYIQACRGDQARAVVRSGLSFAEAYRLLWRAREFGLFGSPVGT